MLLLLVALSLSMPPTERDPFAALPEGARALFGDYLSTQTALGRTFEVLAQRHVRGHARAVLLDRTGGCIRGWVILDAKFPTGPDAGVEYGAEPLTSDDCEKPTAIGHFARLQSALARGDANAVADFVPADTKFPIGLEKKGTLSRKTHTREDILSGKAKVPVCDLLDESVRCAQAEPNEADLASGTIAYTCECRSERRLVSFDLRQLEAPTASRPAVVQLVSVRERHTK